MRIGALIVIEREISLEEYIKNATKVYADISDSLLETIFFPNSPLHDGGVIIQGDRTAICGSSTDGLDRKTGLKKILSFRSKQDLLRILSVPSPYQVLVSAKFATFAANLAKN